MRLRKPRVFVTVTRRPSGAMNAAVADASRRIAPRQNRERPERTVTAAGTGQSRGEATEANVEYLRRVYASTRDWYTAAETKAQLLLAVNGAFVTVLFGVLFGRSSDVHASTGKFGIDTWIFTAISVAALVSAIVCAALSLWSLHGKADDEFARLGVKPADPDSYRAEVLWYFGHIARLQPEAVTKRLLKVDRNSEIEILSYHVIDLAHRVLRKHRCVNLGWAFTALALIALAAAGTSFFVRAQF